MIIIVKQDYEKEQLDSLTKWIKSQGVKIDVSKGDKNLILGLVGDTSKIDIDLIRSLDIVENVKRIQEPFKLANRKFHPQDTIVDVCGHKFGGNNFQLIAGPCSVESEAQIIGIAKAVKAAGANILRGGAFKPRTSPYAFQGLKAEGLQLLLKAKQETGMPICTELMAEKYIDLFEDVDIIPILLKRGLANTIQEWLMSAEYIMSEGNENVILCERGIRTFEPATRNTLDLSAIPLIQELTHLPIIVDPSHASGIARLVEPMSLAAVGAGSQGLIIEVHNDPPHALCDGAQSLRPEQFEEVVKKVDVMLPLVGKVRS